MVSVFAPGMAMVLAPVSLSELIVESAASGTVGFAARLTLSAAPHSVASVPVWYVASGAKLVPESVTQSALFTFAYPPRIPFVTPVAFDL